MCSSDLEERLELPLTEGLLLRWFGPGALYGQRLDDALGATDRASLASHFRHHLGALLPQPLRHTLLLAERLQEEPATEAAATTTGHRPQKKPRRKPGPGA